MKYFTRQWFLGELSEKEMDENESKYERYINKFFDDLPATLKILSKSLYLHDGIIDYVTFSEKNNILQLSGTFGDLQVGYYRLEIKYLNVTSITNDILNDIFLDKKIEILRDEIEVLPNNQYSHRMAFSTKDEIDIDFSALEINIIDAVPSDYKLKKCKAKVLC